MKMPVPTEVANITIMGGDSTDEILRRAREVGGHLAKLFAENRSVYFQQFRDSKGAIHEHPKLATLQIIAERFGFFLSVRQDSIEIIKSEAGHPIGVMAFAELVDTNGVSRGGGQEGICTRDEPGKTSQPVSALLGMAQTRACSRVGRMAFGWVLEMAGYQATPAEEMEAIADEYGRQEVMADSVGADSIMQPPKTLTTFDPGPNPSEDRCPDCGGPLKWYPAGVSKKTNKPYNPRFTCTDRNCGYVQWLKPDAEEPLRQKPPEIEVLAGNADAEACEKAELALRAEFPSYDEMWAHGMREAHLHTLDLASVSPSALGNYMAQLREHFRSARMTTPKA